MDSTHLRVGDPARQRAGLAILVSLAVAAVYAAFTVVTKETPALYLHQPWQDDPYDALVSLDFVALPLLVLVGALRVQLCRRYEALPVRRVIDLLRLCGVTTGLGLVTQLAEWAAVARGTHGAQWDATSVWQAVALGALTAATGGSGVLLRRARHELARASCAAAQPDWLADAVALGLRVAGLLGPLHAVARAVVCWVDAQVLARVRARPIVAALLLAVALTLPEVAAKVVLERYPAPLVLFVFGVSTASLFAFLVVVGSHLRVVAPRGTRPSVCVCAAVTACVAGTLAVALRGSLLAAVGADPSHLTIGALSGLTLAAGVLAGALSLAGQTTLRRLRG